ncbi:MAG: toprim domain-containing protein [Oxalobacter sp.]|nr:toprim domain-containing protein [Oxalobacter sp.]
MTFCRMHGVMVDRLPPAGKIKAFGTERHPRSQNGRVMFDGGWGWVQNWETMTSAAVWFPKKTLTEAEKAAYRQKVQASMKRDALRRHAAKQRMVERWNSLPPLVGGHPYLERKGLSMLGCSQLRIDKDLLVVPMYRNGCLVSLQTISPDGEKRFAKDCPAKGASLILRRRSSAVTCFCEGLATGLSIFQCIPRSTVVVCFNTAGLVEVSKAWKPLGMCCVCADNDHATEQKPPFINPGIKAGTEAARNLHCGLAYPEGIEGTDFNDAMQEWGSSAPWRIRMMVERSAGAV